MNDEKMFYATKGISPIDKLPKITTPKSLYFINTDPAFLPGEHWVCVFFPEKNSPPEFFDSLGRAPTYYSKNIIHFLGSRYMYNSIRLQPPQTSTCGLYCLYFLYHRIRGFSFLEILESFSKNLQHNDVVVIDFYRGFE